jgi:hypothetical protein
VGDLRPNFDQLPAVDVVAVGMWATLALSIMSTAMALDGAADLWTTLWLAQVNRRPDARSS